MHDKLFFTACAASPHLDCTVQCLAPLREGALQQGAAIEVQAVKQEHAHVDLDVRQGDVLAGARGQHLRRVHARACVGVCVRACV